MSKELDYMVDLERENRTLKSLLFCTTKSCNNCGKVNCENFQRQRIDCCGLWVSYKDYITELVNKVEQLQKDLRNKRISIKNKKAEIKELEQQIEKMKCCYNCSKWNDGQCADIPNDDSYYSADFVCDKWEIKEND